MKNMDGSVSPPADSVIALAVSGSTKTKHVVNWALNKFVKEEMVHFKFLHVRPVISRIPTPMGNFIPIAQVRDDVAEAYRTDIAQKVSEKLLPYKKMCTKKLVQVEILQIESDDVETTISSEIRKNNINKLVIGTSSQSIFSRGNSLSSKISQSCPPFCSVYVVSKGKLSTLRPSDYEMDNRFLDETNSEISYSSDNTSSHRSSSTTVSELTSQGTDESFSQPRSSSLPVHQFPAIPTIIQNPLHKKIPSSGTIVNAPSVDVEISSDYKDATNIEVEKLRIELRHARGMYAMAQGEAINASRKLNELQRNRLMEQVKMKQINFNEQEAKELARQEKKRYEAAKREAYLLNQHAEREAAERKDTEVRAYQEAKEKESLKNALLDCFQQYRKFTLEEIEYATLSFSEDLKIGMGAYGTVYKCSFQHTTASVRIFHAKESKQFQQELEILSQIRHPHLLILLGACHQRACLVYEFMENGSLEERLLEKNSTPPLLWFDRFRIAWEIASALAFLHSLRPKSIIHHDLNPSNIFLGRDYICKIGGVGLSTIIDENSLSSSYKDTSPMGTSCYIDPEYQRTRVVSPESDVYAFGIIVLQLLTGQPATGLAHVVEVAMENAKFMDILDQRAGEWPDKESKCLADLALRCTELRRRDRPDFHNEALPVLEKMKQYAEKSRDMMLLSETPTPNHFICPILKEVMADPCVAADGYTYDRKGIEAWLVENNTSPITNALLPHKFLLPNYTLLSAIMDWKSGQECEL